MAIIREDNGDARSTSQTQYTLSVGDILHGSLNPVNDKDWLRVELTAGTIYDFILEGVESAQLEILDAQGNRVAEGQNFFSYTKLKIFSPDTSGTYYIAISSNNTEHTANYELSFEENPITTVDHKEIADYMSFQFPEEQAFDVAAGGVLTANITALNEAGQQLARWALEAWSNVTGIKFEFVAEDDAQITFDDNTDREISALMPFARPVRDSSFQLSSTCRQNFFPGQEPQLTTIISMYTSMRSDMPSALVIPVLTAPSSLLPSTKSS